MIQKMINIDDVTKENTKRHNTNWQQISNHPYRISIIGGFVSGKTDSLFNLINEKPDIDKIYLYGKDLFEAKYQFLINKRERILMILKLLFNTQMIWMIFIKILKNTTQIRNVKY